MFLNELARRVVGYQPTVIYRNEPVHAPAAFPQVSTRAQVQVRTETAPQPVPYSAYSGVGRDAQHATPTMWNYQALAMPEWLSVMGWPFGVAKVPSQLHPSMPRGRALPLRERVNIEAPKQSSLGSLTTLSGVQAYSRSLAKITF